MSPTLADRAAADLHAMMAHLAAEGRLAGVEAEVEAVSGRSLRITILKLPIGAVEKTAMGLAPTAEGARITDLLHVLTQRVCGRWRLSRKAEFRIRPAALQAASVDPTLRHAS